MDGPRWTPPIPTGAAAVAAWRELDHRTRRDLLRRTGPHPDPMVGCVAVGYARTMLARRWTGRSPLAMAALCGGFGLALLGSTAVAAALPAGSRSVTFSVIVFLAVIAVVVLSVVPTARLRLRLIRMENANAAALLMGEAPAPAPSGPTEAASPAAFGEPAAFGAPAAPGEAGGFAGHATPIAPPPAAATGPRVAGPVPPGASGGALIVAHDRRMVLGQQAKLAAITLGIAAVALLSRQWVSVLVLAMCVLTWALMGCFLARWVLPRRPVLVLDADGVRAGSGMVLPWGDVIEIRVLPLRLRNRATSRHRVIAFVCADPQRVIDALGGARRRRARQALEYYGAPLALPTHTLDHTAEQIAEAVSAFRPLPVRHFGP